MLPSYASLCTHIHLFFLVYFYLDRNRKDMHQALAVVIFDAFNVHHKIFPAFCIFYFVLFCFYVFIIRETTLFKSGFGQQENSAEG